MAEGFPHGVGAEDWHDVLIVSQGEYSSEGG